MRSTLCFRRCRRRYCLRPIIVVIACRLAAACDASGGDGARAVDPALNKMHPLLRVAQRMLQSLRNRFGTIVS